MNLSALVGILMAFAVFIGAAVTSVSDMRIFLDFHAFLIVIGGTLAASLISFSGKTMVMLGKIFLKRVLGKNDEIKTAIEELVDLARGYRENDAYLKDKIPAIKTPFLKEALEMMTEGGIDPQDVDKILAKRAAAVQARYDADADMFKSLAKFPPAFGLLGAVIGMIALMQNLGGADAFKKVGPSMAIALVATMYGIAVANFIFLPLGENLSKANRFDQTIRLIVIDGIKLVRIKKHPIVVEESLKSYLLPTERDNIKKAA
ncbi:MAG: MotA/TolQ/ExbB proton channel family protein [Bdellovibrionaceae bacterium]|nr:MotA/TolQ/ExbB proton channel family protein [Pseudobdellovibrionaceae bacterium]MBX3033416.1 MotA/TolQ/ExbB proton channel family protein [Pseudobdellovibrionaceae bacterium]